MNYEQTIELEKNIKIKDTAQGMYSNFLKNIELKANDYIGEGRFKVWSDSHNATFIMVTDSGFKVEFRFLHESYDVEITPQSIFEKIKLNYRGIDHLRTLISRA